MKFVCKGKVNIALILFCSIVLEHFKSFHQYALKKKKVIPMQHVGGLQILNSM